MHNSRLSKGLLLFAFGSLGCTSNPTTEIQNPKSVASDQNTSVTTKIQSDVQIAEKKTNTPPFYGRWALDHNAYRMTPAFQALTPKQKRAAISMLNKLQTDMTIGDGFIEKIGRFNERQVVTKMKYAIAGKTGEIWTIDVDQKGQTRREQWRLSEKHLVIQVDGKDRIYARVPGTSPPKTPARP